MKRIKFIKSLVFIIFLANSSCSQNFNGTDFTSIAANNPDLSKGYLPNGIYVTKKDLLITGKVKFSLRKPGDSEPFIEDYQNDPKSYPQVVGIPRKGSFVKISKIEQLESSYTATIANAFGVIQSGQFAGQEVLLRGISDFIYGTNYGVISAPDHQYIEMK